MSGLHLFEGFGVELEYMLVDDRTLDIRPEVDLILAGQDAPERSEVRRGPMAWSNELVRHVIEIKVDGPVPSLEGLETRFQQEVAEINRIAAGHGCRLMPGGMHPWMDPHRETVLWPYGQKDIYRAFDRIFDCRGHGWSNVQSMHINLPFQGDAEFRRLHDAIRVLMPIMPALAASSPWAGGRATGLLDARLHHYARNCARIPEITAGVIPEPVADIQAYHERILSPMYRALAPHDPDAILREEWVNARGAIARFDRDAIEIRVLDVQECPLCDLVIARLITRTLAVMTEGIFAPLTALPAYPTAALQALFRDVIREGMGATVSDGAYLALFDAGPGPMTVGQVWAHILAKLGGAAETDRAVLDLLLDAGPLAARLIQALGPDPGPGRVRAVWRDLCEALGRGYPFVGVRPE